MGPIASSCAFSVPVMSHFAALNICQTWNILNARLISHAWGVRHPLICPLFFASLSKRSPLYFVDWVHWKKTFLPHFWQRPCMMRDKLVLLLNRFFLLVLFIPHPRKKGRHKVTQFFCGHNQVCPKVQQCFKFHCPANPEGNICVIVQSIWL